ncbi:hypothetical protein [Dyadobacter pollutisoli]|uniref:Uncharacterized protein n=1 Tax=Dyadobacter pollutisoli TaxID=2910158 RepID=A0A9E8NFB5_9BACT|nr:hypothetical protein [Dyadobacter pollutisoli]WAC13526.1 hypothetical protein ON006_06125 [Dyadobacter pollutisoli]
MKNVTGRMAEAVFSVAQPFALAGQTFAQFLRKPLKMVEQQNLK